MKTTMIRLLGLWVIVTCTASAYAAGVTSPAVVERDAVTVIRDDDITISRAEFEQLVQHFWTPQMQVAAANDPALRRELATLTLASKKIALTAAQVSERTDPDFYWELKLQVQGLLRKLMVERYMATLKIPDGEPLAFERYTAEKDKYAKVPERRMSSQILLRCTPPDCDVKKINKTAAEALAALRSGADFAEMVQQYSEDPNSKNNGGKLRWLRRGEPHFPPTYIEGLFAIDKAGEYSDVISTQFGLHIIRLDEIEPSYTKPFAAVKQEIIADYEAEYKKLAAMEFDQQYGPSGSLVMTDAVLDEILAPYKTLDLAPTAQSAPDAKPDAKPDVKLDAKAE